MVIRKEWNDMLYILTLTWNAVGKLSALYRSLLPSLEGLDWIWIVKDNKSKDNTIQEIASWKNDRIKVIAHPNNLQNFSEGVNACFHFANPGDDDLVLLLNNDIIFNDTTSIKKMIDLLNNDPSVGAVGCRLCYTGSQKLQHCGVVIEETSRLPMHFRGNQLSDKAAEMNREFQSVTGACLLLLAGDFRKSFTNKDSIKGLDSGLQWCFDDIDLCFSVKYNLGKKILYCGSTNIWHEESATLKIRPVNKMFQSQNINYFRNKWKDRYICDKSLYEKDPNYNLYKAK